MKAMLIVFRKVLGGLATICSGLVFALAYLLPGSKVEYPCLIFFGILILDIIILFAAIGAEMIYQEYYDHQCQDMD